MPVTTIRICEEPEARIMLKDGSFQDYLQMWFDRIPKQNRPTPVQLRPYLDSGTFVHEVIQFYSQCMDEIRLEIGGKALFRRKFDDSFSLFVKVGDLWARRDHEGKILSAEDLFPNNLSVKEICGEKELMKADIRDLSRSIARKSDCFRPEQIYRFGDHELWTVARWGDTYAHVCSDDLHCSSVQLHDTDIARHIEEYRAAHRKAFGAF